MSTKTSYGPAGWAHTLPTLTRAHTTPAYSSESNKTMMDLGFGEEYGDTPTPAEWKECAGFQEEGKHGFIDFYQQDVVFPDNSYEVNSNNGSVIHRSSELGSSNGSIYANSVGSSAIDGRSGLNNLASHEWDSGPAGNFGPGPQGGCLDQYKSMSHPRSKCPDPEPHQDQETGIRPYYNQHDLQQMVSQQANQQLGWDEYPMFAWRHLLLPTTVNGFGGLILDEQSRGAAVGPNALVNPNTVIDHNLNGGFIPLFLDEKAFNVRKEAREANRKKSDYPYDDLVAQHKILGRLYEAIRNTIGVDDSAKVAAKFADNSIPDAAIHATCWEVMIACRESQECGPLVAKYHGTKHLRKDTFSARIESAIVTLRKSKAACKQALAPSFLERLADQPDEEMKRKTCNQKLNQKKTGQNKAGQQAIAKTFADENGVWIGEQQGTRALAQVDPQLAGEPIGARHGIEDQAGVPAPKRARRRGPRLGSSSGTS